MPANHKDTREISALSYVQLRQRFPRYARALLLLAACRVVPIASVVAFAGAGIETPQGLNYFRRQLLANDFAATLREMPDLVKLGRAGHRLLMRAGVDARYREDPAARTIPALALAGEFAAGMLAELSTSARFGCISWHEPAFHGSDLRPDGECSMLPPADVTSATVCDPFQPGWLPPTADMPGLILSLEVDRGTQYHRQLREKLERWSARLTRETGDTIVFWLTVGGPDRVANLRSLWRDYVGPAHPALFDSVPLVRGHGSCLYPLQATWYTTEGTRETGWSAITRWCAKQPLFWDWSRTL